MTNLSASRDDERQEGVLIDVPFNQNTIYAGGMVCVDGSGYVVKADNAKPFLGVAMESTSDAKAKGRDYIRVWVKGEFEFDFADVAATDLGKHVIVGADDHTIALATEVTASLTYATAYNLIVGKIVKTDTTAKTVRVVLGL